MKTITDVIELPNAACRSSKRFFASTSDSALANNLSCILPKLGTFFVDDFFSRNKNPCVNYYKHTRKKLFST